VGFFHLGFEQLQLANGSKQRLKAVKTSKEAMQFLNDFWLSIFDWNPPLWWNKY
jgi:hypothetical protein